MSQNIFKKLIYFPKEMQNDIEKAAETENRSSNNYIVNVVKKDIDEKKNRGDIKD